ncbi:hypothetical protein [Rickettsia asiatica]|nr:hypothetical protein [Rickettsia asiatica]
MLSRHCERLKGAWQSQDFGTRLLRQNFQFFLAMTISNHVTNIIYK